jgi:hypothetical protein
MSMKQPGAPKRKGYSGGAGNNNCNGKQGMANAMSLTSPAKPKSGTPAPSMAKTLGPGSRGC